MKKPKWYNGYAFQNPKDMYSAEYLKTLDGKKDAKTIKAKNKKYQKHLKEHGWDITETWDLSSTISMFILPRLKAFKEDTISYPSELTYKKWIKILSKIIKAFEIYIEDDYDLNDKKKKQINTGLDLFRKYFFHLWS